MKLTLRTLVPLAALALVSGSTTPPDDLDDFVTSQMSLRHINGLSLAIVQGGKIVTARAYGVTDNGEPRRVDSTTLFQAGSISKSVAALASLRLVEQKKLDLDADINTVLRSWHLPASTFTATKPVTLRGILSHQAGLTVHGFPGYDVDSLKPTLVQVLNGTRPTNTAAIRSYAAPGAEWKYSGGGYTIMQQAVIDVTGQAFPAYMQQSVLAPLGMGRSSYEQPLPPSMAANTAGGHNADGSKVRGRWHVYPEMAAAGLWTTASDLSRFAIAIQDAYMGRPGALISQAMAKDMLTDQKNMDGLGVFLARSGDTIQFSHGGRDEGFDATLVGLASTGQAYAVMINANDDSRFMSRLGAFISKKYNWPGASSYTAPPAVSIAPRDLEAASGLYDIGGGSFITLVPRGGRLFTSVGVGLDEELVPMGGDRFVSNERPLQYRFQRNFDGKVVGVNRIPFSGVSRALPRLGPLFVDARPAPPLEPVTVARGDSALRALSVGGDAVRTLSALLPSARADFGAMLWEPIAHASTIAYVGSSEVSGGTVERHGVIVTKFGYYRVATPVGERLVLVYFTKDNLVTDVDVVDA